MMRTDGYTAGARTGLRTVKMGDVQRDPDKEAPAPPPTLTAPGEKLPDSAQQSQGQGEMKPVQFPKQKPDDYPDAAAASRADQAKGSRSGTQQAQDQADQKSTSRLQPSKPADPNAGTPRAAHPDSDPAALKS